MQVKTILPIRSHLVFFIQFFRFFGGIVLRVRAPVVVVNKDTIPVRFCSREEYVFNGLSRVRTGCSCRRQTCHYSQQHITKRSITTTQKQDDKRGSKGERRQTRQQRRNAVNNATAKEKGGKRSSKGKRRQTRQQRRNAVNTTAKEEDGKCSSKGERW